MSDRDHPNSIRFKTKSGIYEVHVLSLPSVGNVIPSHLSLNLWSEILVEGMLERFGLGRVLLAGLDYYPPLNKCHLFPL